MTDHKDIVAKMYVINNFLTTDVKKQTYFLWRECYIPNTLDIYLLIMNTAFPLSLYRISTSSFYLAL